MRISISNWRVGRVPLRSWIGATALLVFLAGLCHLWLHDAHIGDIGHYSSAVEKACPSKKLVSAIVTICPDAGTGFGRMAVQALRRQWIRVSRDFSTAPRGPPFS